MIGVLLISTKRSVQTSEVFRRIQSDLLRQIDKNVAKGQTNNTRHFMRCAVLELLIAESMCIETQINEKMMALVRMVRFSECSQQPTAPEKKGFSPEVENRIPSRMDFQP